MRLLNDCIDRRPLVERDGSGVSALVGLDGFVVTAQLFDDDSGEWWLAIETTEDRAWCDACAVQAIGHGRRRVVVRDLPMAGHPVRLVWAKRLWRCGEPACPTRTWSEESDEIGQRAVLTERARARSAGGSAPPSTRWPRRRGTSGCRGTRRWRPFGITANRGLITWPGWAPPRRWVWTRRRSWRPPSSTPPCW